VLEAQYQKEKAEAKAQYEAAEKQYRSIEEANRVRLTEISHEAQAQIDKAQLDASNARKSSRRLLDAFSNSSPCAKATPGTATASASAPAAEAGDLQTIMFRRIDEAAGIIGEFADRVSIAGEACERAYEVAR
jgi:dsDNA-specific endonuclease/ATPase MutS2